MSQHIIIRVRCEFSLIHCISIIRDHKTLYRQCRRSAQCCKVLRRFPCSSLLFRFSFDALFSGCAERQCAVDREPRSTHLALGGAHACRYSFAIHLARQPVASKSPIPCLNGNFSAPSTRTGRARHSRKRCCREFIGLSECFTSHFHFI